MITKEQIDEAVDSNGYLHTTHASPSIGKRAKFSRKPIFLQEYLSYFRWPRDFPDQVRLIGKLSAVFLLIALLTAEAVKTRQVTNLKTDIDKTLSKVNSKLKGSMKDSGRNLTKNAKDFDLSLADVFQKALGELDFVKKSIDGESTTVLRGIQLELKDSELRSACLNHKLMSVEVIYMEHFETDWWCWNEDNQDPCTTYRSYNGAVNTTRNGLDCLEWSGAHTKYGSSDDHDTKRYKDVHHNLCRMQSHKGSPRVAPWCWVHDEGVQWDYCFPACKGGSWFIGQEDSECYSKEHSCYHVTRNCSYPDSYTGPRSFTYDNHECKFWDQGTYPSGDRHTSGEYQRTGDHHNYCRIWPSEPQREIPWCIPHNETTAVKKPCFKKCGFLDQDFLAGGHHYLAFG